MNRKLYTLVFVFDWKQERILLGYKKRGFGSSKFNGFGGKVEVNENITTAAIRELNEECGLNVEDNSNLVKVGINLFEFKNHPIIMEVHIFMIDLFNTTGIINESDEMKPEWFQFKDIPFNKMWTDDKHWFPFMFDRKLFQGHFLFQSIDTDVVIEHELKEVKAFYI